MSEEKRVRAPYNFVPFSDKVLIRYEDMSQLPPHDRMDPGLKTGEIHVTLQAESPVFVSSGGSAPDFFKGPDGTYQIPGSTVRGMVRENMQILGFGLIRPGEDLEDQQIYFREMAAARESTGDPLKKYYREVLDVKSRRTPSGKTVTAPQNVRGGYLHRKGETYWIQPVQGDVIPVSRTHRDVGQFGDGHARTVSVSYQSTDKVVKSLKPAGERDMAQGVLLYTGCPVGRMVNHLYLFPEEDPQAQAISVSEQDILSYQMDLEGRKNSLKAYYDVDFWALPKDGERKAVFYARYDGHTYFGRSRFLRIGYKHALSYGLPSRHRELMEQKKRVLDYPSAILGFAGKEQSYKSRVSFGDFRLEGMPKWVKPMEVILGQPKPSYYPGYVEEGKHYNEDEFRLRGYKQYWLKEPDGTYEVAEKKNVASGLKPLAPGSVFRGIVRFKNLTEDELGLLLWSLRLEKNSFQTIGMGKPYGYGRVRVSISSMRELEPNDLYTPEGLGTALQSVDEDAVERYICRYDAYAAEKLRLKKPKKQPSIRSRREVKDFFYVKRTLRPYQQVSYMALGEYKNTSTPLETIQMVQEQEEQAAIPETPVDPMAALLAKYGRKF